MSRDLLGRPPLKASELPPNKVSVRRDARAIACPGCDRWLVPHDGGLRCHTVAVTSTRVCAQSGRRVWFDLAPVQWRARLEAAAREAASQTVRKTRATSGGLPGPGLDEAWRAAVAAAPDILAVRRESDLPWPRSRADRRRAMQRRHGFA